MRKNLRFLLLTLLCAVVSPAWCADTWVKTAPTDLATGDIVAIVDLTSARAMSNDKGTGNAPTATFVTLNSDKSEITDAVGETLQWVVTIGSNTNGDRTYQFQVAGTENYLYCTTSNNGVRVGPSTTNSNNVYIIKGPYGDNVCDYLYNTGNSCFLGVYSNQDWRRYGTVNNNIKATQTAFFKKVTTQGAVDPSDNITISSTTMEVSETVTITKPGDLSVTYSTSDGDVATVSEGVVTGVGEGTATITVSWDAVTDKYTQGSKTFTVTVNAAVARVKFVKVTSTDYISATQKYILVAEDYNKVMGTQDNTKYRTPVDATINNDAILIKESELSNYAVLTLISSNNGWKIKASDDTYLKAGSSALYGNTASEAGIWTITDDFELTSDNYYIQYNASNPRFACYTGQKTAVLYVKYPLNTAEQASATISATQLSKEANDAQYPHTATITTDPADLVVTYSTSDEAVATVSEGVVTGVGVGTATITVSWDEQTVDNVTYGASSQTFDIEVFSNEGVVYQKVTSSTDLTTGKYLIVYEDASVAFDGSLTALDVASNIQSVTITNDKITIPASQEIYFTIDMDAKNIQSASGYYIGVSSYGNGLKTNETTPFTHTGISIDNEGNANIIIENSDWTAPMTLRYNKGTSDNRFRYYKDYGQQAIQLYKEVAAVEPEGVTITISYRATDNKDCFATISNLGEGYFTVPADVEVSTLIVNENGKYEYPKIFTEGEAFPGDGAYLLRGTDGEHTFLPAETPAEPVVLGLNMLISTGKGDIDVAAPNGENDSDYYFYKLTLNSNNEVGTVGFYWGAADGGTFRYGKANQCYLAVPKTNVKLGTSSLPFDATDGIENVTTETRNGETYTLTGVRVSGDNLPRGIYIVNGKKQVVR